MIDWKHQADWTQRDVLIARQFGVTRERVRQVRIELGHPKVKGAPPTDKHLEHGRRMRTKATIRRMKLIDKAARMEGRKTIAERARRLGICRTTLERASKEAGVSFRNAPLAHSVDWSKVDLSKPAIQLSDETGLPIPTLLRIKAVLSPRRADSFGQWLQLDWSKSTAELARQTGRSEKTVQLYRQVIHWFWPDGRVVA